MEDLIYRVARHSFSFPQDGRDLSYFKNIEDARRFMHKSAEERARGGVVYESTLHFFEDNKESIKVLPKKMYMSRVKGSVFFKNTFEYVLAHYIEEITIH
jgi:hypothetical protein